MTFNINARRRFGPLNPTQVPTVPVEVDWAHPLAQGLACLYVPGAPSGLSDIAGNGPTLVALANAAFATGQMGPGFLCNQASGGAQAPATPALAVGSQFTVFWAGTSFGAPLAPSYGPYFAITLTGNSAPFIVFSLNNGGSNASLNTFYWNSGGVEQFLTLNNNIPAFGYGSLAAAVGLAGTTMYYDGASQPITDGYSYPISPNNYIGGTTLSIGYRASVPGRSPNCLTAVASLYPNRTLSPDENAWLNAEPFAMLVPQMRRARRTASSGTAYTARSVLFDFTSTPVTASVARKASAPAAAIGTTDARASVTRHAAAGAFATTAASASLLIARAALGRLFAFVSGIARFGAASQPPSVRLAVASVLTRVQPATPLARVQTASILTRVIEVTMSTPQPIVLNYMRQSTVDTRGLDLSQAVAPGDTIASITGITVVRNDGHSLASSDLTITPAGYGAPFIGTSRSGQANLSINWWQGVGAVGTVGYTITVAFLTAGGAPLTYDAAQQVTATLG